MFFLGFLTKRRRRTFIVYANTGTVQQVFEWGGEVLNWMNFFSGGGECLEISI